MKLVSSVREITFDDVLLLPGKSSIPVEREETAIDLSSRISRTITLGIPIVSSPMPGVTESAMAIALGKAGGLGFIHQFQSFDRQTRLVKEVKEAGVKVAASVSVFTDEGMAHVGNLLRAGADLISIDWLHAHNAQVLAFTRKVRKKYPSADINVAVTVTREATLDAIRAGADSIRVGVGPGSHCTTRLVTGVGRPQLSAIAECYQAAKRFGIPLIAEGGVKHAGDIPKALVFGAAAVMIGGLFAGTDEAPGDILMRDGKRYKMSWGMCTDTAYRHAQFDRQPFLRMVKDRVKRLLGRPETFRATDFFEEGVADLVPYKGPVDIVLRELVMGLRRSMWYQGVNDVRALRSRARAVLVSSNTTLESQPRI